MGKLVISVLGQDRPGIIARVSGALFAQDCNIENVSQTILQSEFSGIFIVTSPQDLPDESLRSVLENRLADIGCQVHIKPVNTSAPYPFEPSEPFVVTTLGPDRKGLVAGITDVLARHRVNVTQLQAVFKGGDDPMRNTMVYEVDVPNSADRSALSEDLRNTARAMGLDISIQHRDIFEAVHRL